MNIPNFIEKAKSLIRETYLFIEVKNNDEIVAYANEEFAIRFIV